jgi:ribokinase
MFDIISFGSAVVDVFVNTDVSKKKNFISYPTGSKILIKELRFDIGGGGTNTSIAFSRLGLKTGYIGKLGDDENGKRIRDMLKKEKVKFLGRIGKNKKSGYSIVLDSKDKDRTILTFKGINNDISYEDIKKFKTRWLYFSSLLEKSFKTQKKLAEKLIKKGVKIAFNPSDYLIKENKKQVLDLLKLTYVLILNKEEAQMITNEKDLLDGLHKLGPKIIVITDKDNIIKALDKNKKYSLKPNKIKVVERTGAGDAFASGFVAGLVAKRDIDFCLKLGLKESESVIQRFGAKNNLLKMKLK